MRAMQGAAGAVSFVLAFIAVQLLLTRFARFALDRPNERSLHEHPVPRTGGIAVLVGIAAAAPFGIAELWLALGLALALAAISFADDLKGLPVAARLGAHLLAASVLIWYLLSPIYVWQAALLVPAPRAGRAPLASAPRPLLPAVGAQPPRPPRHGVCRLYRHGALCGRSALRLAAHMIRSIYHRRFIVFAHDLAAAGFAWV